jgi:hypothetical protein
VKKPRAYALRYPLPYCEIADGELMQSGVDTLPTKEDYSSDATESFDEQRYLEGNKFTEKLMQSGVDTLQTKADYSSDATESFDERRYLEANKFREELMQSGVDTLQTKEDYLSDHATTMACNSPEKVNRKVQMCRAIRKRKQKVRAISKRVRKQSKVYIHLAKEMRLQRQAQ